MPRRRTGRPCRARQAPSDVARLGGDTEKLAENPKADRQASGWRVLRDAESFLLENERTCHGQGQMGNNPELDVPIQYIFMYYYSTYSTRTAMQIAICFFGIVLYFISG
jgi:hypothetical protein